MLITFSHHSGATETGQGSARFLPLTRYMDAPVVVKQIGRRREAVLRSPAPEVLAGRAETLRQLLAALPFRHRYTSLVLSFAAADIDIAALNVGDRGLRGQVDLVLRLALDLAWAGIPAQARPPFYATTHSHAGRLEVNLALPRAVFRPDGRLRSHNPHPPGAAGQSLRAWLALQDLANHRFGWADPLDPGRRQALAIPDFLQKRAAEMAHAGSDPQSDPRIAMAEGLNAAIAAGEVADAATGSPSPWPPATSPDCRACWPGDRGASTTAPSPGRSNNRQTDRSEKPSRCPTSSAAC